MKIDLKKLSFWMIFYFSPILYAQESPPTGCLDDLKEIYRELQKEENQAKNLLDILSARMEKTVYRYSKAYLEQPGISVNSNVQKYLNEKIKQNTQIGFERALSSTFGKLQVDTSSFPQKTQAILDGEFNQVDKFIIKGLLNQSSCTSDNLCTDGQTLESFHGILMNINNNPQNSIEAKKILEDEYSKLSDRFAGVLAGKLRNYVEKQKENEQCRDYLSSIPASALNSVNPLLLLGCESSNQTPLSEDIEKNLVEIVEHSQSNCMIPYLYVDYVYCDSDASDSSQSPAALEDLNVWSISIEKEGSVEKREIKLKAVLTKPARFNLTGGTSEDQNTWGSFSWKCDDEDCGDNKNETTIQRKNKAMEVEVSFAPNPSMVTGEGLPERISTKTDIEAFCENYSSLGCQDEEDEEGIEDESEEEVGNLFDHLNTCYLNLSPGFCNQMIPPHRGVGLPPDPVSWTFGHN